MSVFPLVKGRITGAQYLAATEPQRNALIAGLADMLDLTVLYTSDDHKVQIETSAAAAGRYETSALRELLDTYVRADEARLGFLIASNFVAALRELCKAST